MQKFNPLSAKLSSDNKINVENTFEFDEDSDISEIFVEVKVDCSEFFKSKSERAKVLSLKILLNSHAFMKINQSF